MKLETCQLFAQMCESVLPEASTSMSMIQNKPGGVEVVKDLHTNKGLAHDQSYQSVDKISWSSLKDAYKGSWVIIHGAKGTGAIQAKGGTYYAVASAGGEVKEFRSDRGGTVIDFLKGEIGKLTNFFVGKNTTTVADKQRKRTDAKAGAASTEVTQDTLIKKFKPLWTRAMTAAIADIKGHIANQIKNDAFAKAKKKISQVESLQDALDNLESGDTDTPGFIRSSVQISVLMAASHYYPETTGNITKGYGNSYESQFREGPTQLLKDISAGDTKKLGTILAFFKRALISG
jgi:hypothetical protein